MSYVKKITLALAILAGQSLAAADVDFVSASLGEVQMFDERETTLSFDTAAILTKKRNQQLSARALADMQSILQSPAAGKAVDAVRAQATRELYKKKAHMVLINFYTNNRAIFSKWSNIYADFAQELLRTMSLGEILENFGINPSTLGVVANTQQRSVESKADEEAKDLVITGILQKGKNALTSLISFGIGSIISIVNMVQNQAQKLIKDTSDANQNPEELLQLALRVALKKNLNLAQLKALHEFSQTAAFETLTIIAPGLQKLFLETLLEDPEIAEKLLTYYAMAMSMTTESAATAA